MVAIKIPSFGGIAPRTSARYLSDSGAQIALNVDTTRRGPLVPTKSFGASLATVPSGTKTLFRYNEDYVVEDNQWWVKSQNDVDFCRGQITGDAFEVLYYTDNDDALVKPQFTYSDFINTSGNITLSYDLGVAAPTLAPIASATTASTTDGLSVEYRTYAFTYVWTKAGRSMESGPSPAAASTVEVYLESDQVITVDTLTTAPPNPQMGTLEVTKRIYRSVAGTFLFVAEIPVSQQTFTDTVDPADLGEEITSLTWEVPPAGLNGMTNMANGIVAGFLGRDVYFCEPYIPHAWPSTYAVTVASPLVALASLDTTLVALTNERPYFIQGSDPSLMTVVEADIAQACVSKRSVVAMNGEVYFASPDGLVAVGPRGSRIITESKFTYNQWNDLLDPTTIYGYTQDLKYFGFHSAGAFIYDLPSQEFVTLDVTLTAAFPDLRLDKLYVVDGTDVVAWGEGSNSQYEWKSKVFSMPREVSFGFMQVEAEAYPVDAYIYADGQLVLMVSVQNRNPFRLPSILARDWEVKLDGSSEVFNVALAQSAEELAGV